MTRRPPRLAERLLAWSLPPDEREFVLGDLAEQFSADLEAGRRAAVFDYWREALAAAWQVRRTTGATRMPRRKRPGGDGPMVTFLHELTKAARRLRRAPGFTAAAGLIAATGLGAATAIFSVVRPVLFEPLRYAAPEQLVMVWETDSDGSNSRTGYATFVDLARESRTLVGSAVIGGWQPTISGGAGDPERLTGQRVSWRFFDLLGVRPAVGRSFVAAEDAPGQPRVVILSHGVWARRFGGDSSLVGRTVTLDGIPIEVVGVLPAGFDDVFEPGAQIYRILGYDAAQPWGCRTCRHLRMVARIEDGVTHAGASVELNALSRRIVAAHPTEYAAAGVNLVRVQEEVTREARPALLSVLVAAVLLLLISSANVTGLGLARAARRREEFAVRAALGAGRPQLARQLLAEGLLLALLGGAGGVLIAWGAVRALVTRLPADLPRLAAVRLDPWALAFAAAVTLGIGMLVGLAPLATRVTRQPFNAIRGAGRLSGPRRHWGRPAIVVGEVALALMLLVGTGLLGRSLLTLLAVSPGFDPDRLLTLEIQSTGPLYDENGAVWDYHDRVRSAVLAVPGVVAAEVTSQLPLGTNFDGYGVQARDKPLANPALAPGAQRYAVSTGYLGAMRIPMIEGRSLATGDAADSAPRVAVVSAALARRIWNGESAIGKQMRVGGREWRTVVGIVGDVRHTGLETTDLHGFYVPERQWNWAEAQAVLVVRTAIDAAAQVENVVRAARSVDPTQPVMHVRSGREVIATSTARRRLALTLFATFGLVATLLSAAGVYGVLAGSVTERRREIGIRSALGATPHAIMNLVLRQGMALAGGGLVLGAGGALALTRYLRSMLFGVGPADPATLVATAILLAAVALVACVVPAWRAMRVDPVTALETE